MPRESEFGLRREILVNSRLEMRNLIVLVGVGHVVLAPGQVPDHVQLVLVDQAAPVLGVLKAAASQLEFPTVPVLLRRAALLHLAVDGPRHLLSSRALVKAARVHAVLGHRFWCLVSVFY